MYINQIFYKFLFKLMLINVYNCFNDIFIIFNNL